MQGCVRLWDDISRADADVDDDLSPALIAQIRAVLWSRVRQGVYQVWHAGVLQLRGFG